MSTASQQAAAPVRRDSNAAAREHRAARLAETTSPPRAYLSRFAAAVYVGLSERALDEFLKAGKIPSYRLGSRRIVIKISDLDAWVEAGRIPTPRRTGAVSS
jgi:excisionase family DNA binding protein